MFKTVYMPLKIFACRCYTEYGANPCDEELEGQIRNLANNWVSFRYFRLLIEGIQKLLQKPMLIPQYGLKVITAEPK